MIAKMKLSEVLWKNRSWAYKFCSQLYWSLKKKKEKGNEKYNGENYNSSSQSNNKNKTPMSSFRMQGGPVIPVT